jgi:hypothetical protein
LSRRTQNRLDVRIADRERVPCLMSFRRSGRHRLLGARDALTTLGLLAVGLAAGSCGAPGTEDKRDGGHRAPLPARGEGTTRPKKADPKPKKADPKPPRCPSGVANCRRAKGRVIYVERVDPDGGGDAHLVLASRHGITAPGLTVVDLEPRVRPARLPRPGDWVGAAGPVYRGSEGQRQIEATSCV